MAHFFRDVDLKGRSCPEFIPEAFPPNCLNDDDQWSAGFLLRYALRFHHVWATYGVQEGKRTILGPKAAVSFTDFKPAELIDLREGARPQDGVVTQYALTFPLRTAMKCGIQRFEPCEQADPEDMDTLCARLMELREMAKSGGLRPSRYMSKCSDWRWTYPGNYQRCIEKIEANGFEGNTTPGLKLQVKKWSGIGVVVPDMKTAREVRYDILTLIDRKIVSCQHFSHILVCDKLAANAEGISKDKIEETVLASCMDWDAPLWMSSLEAHVSTLDFSSCVLIHGSSRLKGPVHERGGCWLWFEDNTHRYVRALVTTGRIKVNKMGRYLASLDELDPGRDLREREEIALEIAKELEQKHGIKSTYFSVLNSQCPDDDPAYCGGLDGGYYYIRGEASDA
ncbi:hypothetical protein C6382_02210 [Pseudomonas sp. BBP2017]|nr:hypothetical protein C6382_02210 [Pseudomonas sp. BBP2017]